MPYYEKIGEGIWDLLLVVIQTNTVDNVVGDTLSVSLQISLKKCGSSGCGQREWVWDLGTVGLLAEMSVSNGGKSNSILC
jgi:hypothetical protein